MCDYIPMITPPPSPPAPTAQADTQHHQHVLNSIIDMGHALARRLHDQVLAVPDALPDARKPDAPTLEATIVAFDRIARCVRRTVLLAQHIRDAPSPRAARPHILRHVENAIDRAAFFNPGTIDKAAAAAELRERLDAPELMDALDADIATRPIADIVAELCDDLGLRPTSPITCPPRRRTPKDIAVLNAAASPKSSQSVNPSYKIDPAKPPS